MGFFSDKKKITVNVTTQPIFEESQIPTSTLNGIVKGILGDMDMVPTMLDELSQCMGIRAMSAMYNAEKYGYNVGIPKAQVKSFTSGKAAVIAAIEANIGKKITPEYYYMGPLNSMHYGWQYCHDALGYDPQTNELKGLSASTGFKCYLSDMVATYLRADFEWMVESNDMGMLDQLGPSPTSGFRPSAPFNTLTGMGQYAAQPPYEVSDVATEDYVTISYEFIDENGTAITRGITATMSAFDNTADFHMCRYTDTAGKTGFFTYLQGSGIYPAIDAAMEFDDTTLGTYFPWCYFRVYGEDSLQFEDRETQEQMIDWCSSLGVSYDKLHAGVHEDPNVDDVEQSMLIMALHPGNKNASCREYLFKHFRALHANTVPQPSLDPTQVGKMQAFTSSPSQLQHISDNRFAMSFQFSGISQRRIVGSIGKKGTYNSYYGQMDQNSQVFLTQTANGVGRGNQATIQPGWVYQHQVMDSVYDEIVVYGLRVNYEVHGKKGYAAGEQAPGLLIPVDRAVVDTMSVPAREQMLCRALTMMVNTVQITTTPWYASSAFKIVLMVVAVVITFLSAGTAWQTIVAAAAVGATALAIAVLTMVVQAVVISYGVKLFAKAVGPEFAMLIAIVAVAYGNYVSAASETTVTWAENLVTLGTALVKEGAALSQAQIAAGFEDLASDIEAFSTWSADQMDGLGDKMSELGLNPAIVGLGAFDVVKMGPMLVLGEDPQDYYQRTVHSGNVGVMAFNMTESFVATKLLLPTFNQTSKDFTYGGD